MNPPLVWHYLQYNIITKNLNDQSLMATIIIDFDGISVISSSFADEFIGKLVEELGFSRFNNIIKIVNVTTNVEHIINRSVSQRMAQMLYG